MNRIRLLPEQVANQIAAGEVVERPASVVKELVENSLDAGARRITVEIQAGGRQLVRVADDGQGMSRDDALLCLERHATSKIRLAEDLAAISTLGFRGEALPSIASVSRFSLTTREQGNDSPEGTEVVVHGGKIIEVKAAGRAPGTTVEARQLFFNLPARRKFLRSEETERAHIQHYLTLAALAHPTVGFTLRQEDRVVWQLPALPPEAEPRAALRERLRALLGSDLPMAAVEYRAPALSLPEPDAETGAVAAPKDWRIWGFIGSPGVSRSTREDQHLYVNRRPIENRGLNYALIEGCHTTLMKGRFPVGCLFLDLDPAEVDVNVHPAKREVKFRHEHAVRTALATAVRQALLDYHDGRAANPDPGRPHPTPLSVVPSSPAPAVLPRAPAPPPPAVPPLTSDAAAAPAPVQSWLNPVISPVTRAVDVPRLPDAAPAGTMPARPAEPVSIPGPTPLLQVPLRLVGVVGNLYVVFESDRGMVLMDQHAAHERVLFEQMLRRMEQGQAPSQRLLLPETVEVSVRDALFLRDHLDTLVRLGVGLSEFGDRTFLLDALPPFVKVSDARRFVLELVDELSAAGRQVNALRLGEHTVAKTVCRHAVKANDPLAGPELENLLADLRTCTMPYTCPHGRPTLIEMSYKELEKKFGRVQ